MRFNLRFARLLVALFAALLLLPLTNTSASAATVAEKPQIKPGKAAKGKPVTVMTRNIYLGGDIFRPVEAANKALAEGKAFPEVLHAVATAADTTWANVVASNFPARAKLLAKEIKKAKPDMVGLQEVSLWRSGPVETTLGAGLAVPNSTKVEYDFLEILMTELKATGAKYTIAVEGLRADVEAPAWTATQQNKRDIRLTMRDVILRRQGAGKIVKSGDAIYTNNLAVSLGGVLPMNFDRGYQFADIKSGRLEYRFINTHLEAASSDIAYGQAAEAVDKLLKPKKTTIFVCDCNSDPLNDSIKPTDTVPHKMAYDYLMGSAGFIDQWLEWAPAKKGWTSGLSELVNDATNEGFDHRIDLILAHTKTGEPLEVKKGEVVGDEVKDRDPATGLWPSDHAGVVLKLKGLPLKKK